MDRLLWEPAVTLQSQSTVRARGVLSEVSGIDERGEREEGEERGVESVLKEEIPWLRQGSEELGFSNPNRNSKHHLERRV